MSTLFNRETGRWENVPDTDVAAGLQSGKYVSGGAQPQSGNGYTVNRTPEEAAAISGALGESENLVKESEAANAAAAARREEALSDLDDKALTFAEGAIDALSFGVIHGRREQDEFRRQVNSGSALLGQLTGTAVGMGLPGIGTVARGGSTAGKALARALLGEAVETSALGRIAERATEEAAIGAGLMGSASVGHQLSDAIIEDKDFAGAAVLHDMGLGAALGFGAGALSGGFKVAASRGAIKGQGGLVDATSTESRSLVDEIHGVRSAYDDVLETHAKRSGVLDQLEAEGQVTPDFVKPRREAIARADAARAKLANVDIEAALNGEVKDYEKLRQILPEYRQSVEQVDALFREVHPLDVAPVQQLNARPQAPVWEGGVNTIGSPERYGEMPAAIDAMMEADPAARARYAELHGRDWEPIADRLERQAGPIKGEGGLGPEAERFREDFATPEQGTVGGKRKPIGTSPVSEAQIVEETPSGPFSQRINGGVTGAFERGELRPGAGPVPESAAMPPSGEYTIAEPIRSRLDQRDIGLTPDGNFAPAREIEGNAEAFNQFRQRTATAPELKPELVDEAKTIREATPRGEPDKTYRDPYVERGTPAPKEPRKSAPEEPTTVRPRRVQRAEAVQRYLDDWYQESRKLGPRLSPGDAAAVRLDAALRKLEQVSGGRLNSAGSLELGEKLGLKPTNDMLVDRLDQIWALRKAARFAADEARGVATPLSKAKASLTDEVLRRFMRRQGALIGAAHGGPFGAAVGWVIGGHLEQSMGFGARAASSAGRLKQLVLETGEKMLRGRKATIAARAVAGNRAYAYTEDGPVQDPIERIRTIHRLAANPEQIRTTVRNQLGDVVMHNPEVAQSIEDTAVRQVTNLSIQAPHIYFDQLGRAVQPTAGALRRFFEYENSTHDLPGLLGAIGRGSATPVQLSALWEQHQQVHAALSRALMNDPEALAKKPTAEIRAVEQVLGIPLTAASSDPGHVARFQAGWAQSSQPQQGNTPQAFKITAPAPTRVQANATGVAPGNEQQQ